MARGRDTGKGNVHIDMGDVDDPLFLELPCKAVSFENYNIDGDELKPEHKLWLDQYLVPFAKSDWKTKLKVEGFASRSGAAAYNQVLSERRVKNLILYLVGKGIPQSKLPFGLLLAHGERQAMSNSNECPTDRAVRISIVTDYRPPPPPPRRREKGTPGKPDEGWWWIPPTLEDRISVVVQEVYLRFDYIYSDGEDRPKRESRPWRRLDHRTTWGVVDPSNTGSVALGHGMRGMCYWRDPGMQKWVNGHLAVFSAVAAYTYQPPAEPSGGPGFSIPVFAEDVFLLYQSGSAADPPRRGPV